MFGTQVIYIFHYFQISLIPLLLKQNPSRSEIRVVAAHSDSAVTPFQKDFQMKINMQKIAHSE